MPILGCTAALCLAALSSTQTMLLRDPAPDLFQAGKVRVIELSPMDPEFGWQEAVPSWNVENPESAELNVEARVIYADRATKYYSFGLWSGSALIGTRWSVDGQRDSDGTVATDTLRMAAPGGRLQFRLTARALPTGKLPKLRRMYVTFSLSAGSSPDEGLPSGAWGKVMELPQLAQGDYPGGKGLCSPTAVAMVLSYWAGRTGLPLLNCTVPEVQSSVYDSVYKGTGNWSFNASFGGSKRGMTGFVARMGSIRELESWVLAGVPVICSVSWYLLHGEEIRPDEEGHLVVLTGFTTDGEPVFNDPGKRGEVRKTYRRGDFLKAWQHSKQTAYVICPPRFVQENRGRVEPLSTLDGF